MKKSINFGAFATLPGYKLPNASGDQGMKISEGKLSDMVKHALALSEREYHGLSIRHDGPLLHKQDMEELTRRPDFPTSFS
jgi:hypothetical protein